MKESPLIVPIQLESDAPKKVTPICCIQINGVKSRSIQGLIVMC